MAKKRKPRLTKAQIVARLVAAFKYDGYKTCSCKFCVLSRRVIRERKS